MTHDPTGNEIPELAGRLEDSLIAPDPSAIHAGLDQRQAARKRTLGVAGAFVAILTIAGGALALTNDDATSTFTAAEDVAAFENLSSRVERPAVASDSAPVELEGIVLVPGRSIRDQLINRTWRVGAAHGDSQGFVAQSGFVMFNTDPDTYGLPDGVDTVLYTTGCEGSAYVIEWAEPLDLNWTEPVELLRSSTIAFRVVTELPTIPIVPIVSCASTTKRPVLVEGSGITIGQAEGSNAITMGVQCHPLGLCTPQGLWTIELIGAAAPPSPVETPPPGEPIPVPVGPAGLVQVDENCLNSTTVQVGDDLWFATSLIPEEWHVEKVVNVIVEAIGGPNDGWLATDSRGLSAQFGNTSEEATARSCQRWEHFAPIPSTTTSQPPETTTTPPVLTGPDPYEPTDEEIAQVQLALGIDAASAKARARLQNIATDFRAMLRQMDPGYMAFHIDDEVAGLVYASAGDPDLIASLLDQEILADVIVRKTEFSELELIAQLRLARTVATENGFVQSEFTISSSKFPAGVSIDISADAPDVLSKVGLLEQLTIDLPGPPITVTLGQQPERLQEQ